MNQINPLDNVVRQAVERKINYWKDRLTDLSGRNRLLFFRPTKTSTLEINHPSFLELFDRVVVKGKALTFPLPDENGPMDDEEGDEISKNERVYGPNEIGTRQSERRLPRILYNLRSRARTAREEKGVNVLYLAFGLLSWRESTDGEFAKAPLILVPVHVTREGLMKPYQLSMIEEDIVVNPSLQIKLQQDFNLELPDLEGNIDADGMMRYLQQVTSLITDYPGWQVIREVVLGIFNFQNLLIIADLERNQEAFINHPLIRSLCTSKVSLPVPDCDLIEAKDLDDQVASETVFQVLDADSSQQEAIEAAKAGLSFVIQGPPGTGKSQTIANIIAEFLAQGKKVLFVSQKIAALKVVQNRMNQVGLGEFCLQIHSDKRDKKEVVIELGQSLHAPSASSPRNIRQVVRDLDATRQKLNAFVRALHKPRFSLGITAFRAHGELARLSPSPRLRFALPGLEKISTKEHQDRLQIISEIATYPQVIDIYNQHPWKGCNIDNLTLDLRHEIEQILQDLASNIASFQSLAEELALRYSVPPPSTLQETVELLRVARVYKPEIIVQPVESIRHRYLKYYRSLFRYFRPSYWKDSALLRDLTHAGERPDPFSTITELEFVGNIQKRRGDYVDKGFDLDLVASFQAPRTIDQTTDLARRVTKSEEFISTLFEKDNKPNLLIKFYIAECNDVIEWCRRQADQIDGLVDWSNFYNVRRQGESIGLASFISTALGKGLTAEDWPKAYSRGFYTLLVDASVQSDPALRLFKSVKHNLIVEQFRTLDLEYISLIPKQIQAQLTEIRPQGSWMKAASAEEALLRRELNKKRRLKPLRRLFSEIPDLIMCLKPCLMMSPLTVSQMLDPDIYKFDLVIFDEASQVPPEYSVGSIMRGDQVVIAGDKHQLPPTRFFEALESDVYVEEELDEFESILNECDAAGMPSKMLLWHYRSRDESLIAFSNYHFYLNRLFTFPSANRDNGGTGIEFIHVPEGIYRKGKGARNNIIEAKRVVQLIIEHLKATPDLSLGVVTFSLAQRDAIIFELERTIRDWPHYQALLSDQMLEPFFVKSLEAVQGDERDNIIFSVGYGFDETGRFLMNFGPLSRAGGERRLNVAVTRARSRVLLVASIQPEDIDLSRTKSKGAKLLRSYMTFARDGVMSLFADISIDQDAEFESPFEESVYEALTDRGVQLQKQVGVSGYRIDLAAVDPEKPGRFLLGIECDGAMYHSAATARDRDRLRQQVLENLGWQIHRIWSRDWIENRNREIEKVIKAIEKSRRKKLKPLHRTMKKQNNPSASSVAKSVDVKTKVKPPQAGQKIPGTQPYRKANLGRLGYGAESFHNTSRMTLVRVLKTVVDAEGPIAINLAKRRIANAWGINRIGRKISTSLDLAIIRATREGGLIKRSGFLWSSKMKRPLVRVPQGRGKARSIEEIAIEELAEGAYICGESALSIGYDDLVKETARLFGSRVTSFAGDRIRTAIKLLIEDGRLEWRGGKIRRPRK